MIILRASKPQLYFHDDADSPQTSPGYEAKSTPVYAINAINAIYATNDETSSRRSTVRSGQDDFQIEFKEEIENCVLFVK